MSKRSPAVTFGKGGRRPTQNRIAVEESSLPQNDLKNQVEGQIDELDENDLDLTQIPH